MKSSIIPPVMGLVSSLIKPKLFLLRENETKKKTLPIVKDTTQG